MAKKRMEINQNLALENIPKHHRIVKTQLESGMAVWKRKF